MIPQQIIKKSALAFLFIFTVLFLTACWDREEVNDLALVTAAGIDKKANNKIELTVLVFIPKGGGGQQSMEISSSGNSSNVLVRSAEGTTIADAMSKLQEKLPRTIFWGHSEVFIFNEALAKDGIRDHIDFIMRHPQLRERGQIFVSKQKAKDILELMPPLERDLSEVLNQLVQHEVGMNVTTKKLAQMLIGDSGDCALPWIKILPPEKGKKQEQTIAYITGTAIFKKDKMVGVIDSSVTRGVLWLRDEIRLAIVTIKPPHTEGYISVNLTQASSKLLPKIEDGKWKITLQSESNSDIVQNTTKLDVSNPEVGKMIEKQVNKAIESRIRLALKLVQKDMKADVFGFSEAFHRKYPDRWNKEENHWDEIFPNVEVLIKTKSKIRRQGMSS
ncbi:Ger(x)C family spore germination protein [Neobacillus cucumis]|uniref:Ger(x)C family spore germination protein n=1 Tax=Neobacillus cucumis TaxID=1740721 RepID=UPI0018E02D55|nr:Ger(x)C family spore germination protein [Neobacillus cucumis]MBI0581178.1 Ger(x)C family spore germination protein [Neobacillus cucumis]